MPENPFETRATEYDAWYEQFPNTFRSELEAIRALLPPVGRWIEIGVGTGRFAAELGISMGIEPTRAMAEIARRRGIHVIRGSAERLPLAPGAFDAVFFITTLCFVEDLNQALLEAFRILVPGGHCIIGILPHDSLLGQFLDAHKQDDVFFCLAQLRTRSEIAEALARAGFTIEGTVQTLLGALGEFEMAIQPPQTGPAEGSFVAIRAIKDSTVTAADVVSADP
ncbi:class I SAM-dependent methyltransferase [Candidatus Bipolaricaulota bacterium]|nr:class I SAM-dependent methyltransferase [Candidatus Bipolaricaulota bacterium]